MGVRVQLSVGADGSALSRRWQSHHRAKSARCSTLTLELQRKHGAVRALSNNLMLPDCVRCAGLLAVCGLAWCCASCGTTGSELTWRDYVSSKYPKYPKTQVEDVVFVQSPSPFHNQWVGCEFLQLAQFSVSWPSAGCQKDDIPATAIQKCKKKVARLGGDAAVLVRTVGGQIERVGGRTVRCVAKADINVVRYVDRECKPILAYFDYCRAPYDSYVERPFETIGDLGTYRAVDIDSANFDQLSGFGSTFEKLCVAFADSGRAIGGDAIIIRLCKEETSATAIRYSD
jgi:hypothetical protein